MLVQCEVEVFETSRSGTQPLGVVGVHPPWSGLPVTLVGLLLPHPLPQRTQSCCAGMEEGSGKSLWIGWA